VNRHQQPIRGSGLTAASALSRTAGRATAVAALAITLVACGGSDGSDGSDGQPTTASAAAGPTYSTTAFVAPFDVAVPDWLPAEVTTDAAHFVTWESPVEGEPAVRFLVPVSVYRPGDTEPTPPPEDYVAYLLSQSEHGATFADTTETTVGGEPATLVTATVDESLDGSIGCPEEGIEAADCYGVQPDLALRIAVIDAGDTTVLAWLRHTGAPDTEEAAQEFAAFEKMLATVSFRDEAPPTTDATTDAAATPIDGTWTTSFSKEELAHFPRLDDAGEVNDQNWGEFTFSFEDGGFTFDQRNRLDDYSVSGTFTVEDDAVLLALDNGEQFAMRYSIEDGRLAFRRDDALGVAPTPYVLKPWRRSAASPLVGEWQRDTTCEERVKAFVDAGLGKYAAENVVGDGFVPGVGDVSELEDPAHPCVGAVPTKHSHFFTADGEFGSRDADGNQVDDGQYRMVGPDSIEIGSFEGWVRFRYEVEADTLRLFPVLPKCARHGCFDAQWALSVSYDGLPWARAG
jgi:hypothetical protein